MRVRPSRERVRFSLCCCCSACLRFCSFFVIFVLASFDPTRFCTQIFHGIRECCEYSVIGFKRCRRCSEFLRIVYHLSKCSSEKHIELLVRHQFVNCGFVLLHFCLPDEFVPSIGCIVLRRLDVQVLFRICPIDSFGFCFVAAYFECRKVLVYCCAL